MTRRELLAAGAAFALPMPKFGRSVRFGVITDLHHGLAPDATSRLEKFVAAANARQDLDFVIQLGDFCHPSPLSEVKPFLSLWNCINVPKYHVLGNHDMDRGSKGEIQKLWGMPSRYGEFEAGGWRFIYLDLNHFRKDGKLHAYERGNYFTDNASHNRADPEQLEWLATTLKSNTKPTIVFSHQPLGVANPDGRIPPEQE